MDKFRHKKAFGQHFLKSAHLAAKIAEAMEEKRQTGTVLEIGPGKGILTQFLLDKPYRLYISEIDHDVIDVIDRDFGTKSFSWLKGDFLKADLGTIEGNFSIIGNFPYNISTQILFRMLEHKDRVPLLVGMFQREVAQRVASGPGNKDYGITSVLCQAYYTVEYLFTVDESEFVPPPKVKSGVIRLERKPGNPGCREEWLFRTVKMAFNQRRKTLRNSLKSLLLQPDEEVLQYLDKRPEQLDVNAFVHLASLLDPEKNV